MRESLFSSSMRSFLTAFFAIIGLCFGFIVVVAIFGSLAGSGTTELETTYTAQIIPNANGERKLLSKEAPVILRININGIIGGETLTMGSVRTQLMESRESDLKNDRVKALLLHINTPGGTVVDSDGIYRALKAYKERYKVPVYAYVDGMCASGGMYVAAAADKIFANDVSLIGSVGVIFPSFFNFTSTLEKIGATSLTLSAGRGKDDMNPFRPWKQDEQNTYQALIDYYYGHFLDVVVSNRPEMDKTKLINEYGAKVFPAQIAEQYGYIDESNISYSDTLSKLKNAIGIDDDYYQVVQLEKKTWYSELFGTSEGMSLFSGKIKHQLELSPMYDPKLMNQPLYLYHPGF